MAPLYDLILKSNGDITTRAMELRDASEAWRIDRLHYPSEIYGVVLRDAPSTRPSTHR